MLTKESSVTKKSHANLTTKVVRFFALRRPAARFCYLSMDVFLILKRRSCLDVDFLWASVGGERTTLSVFAENERALQLYLYFQPSLYLYLRRRVVTVANNDGQALVRVSKNETVSLCPECPSKKNVWSLSEVLVFNLQKTKDNLV